MADVSPWKAAATPALRAFIAPDSKSNEDTKAEASSTRRYMSPIIDSMPVEVPVVVLAALVVGITIAGETGVPVIVFVMFDRVVVFTERIAEESLNVFVTVLDSCREFMVSVELNMAIDVSVDVLISALVIVLVSDIVKLVDLRIRVEELDVPVSALVEVLLTALVAVVGVIVVELTEVFAIGMVKLVDLRLTVKDLVVLRVLEVAVVGVVIERVRHTPHVAPRQDAGSTTKHQRPPEKLSGLQQDSKQV